MIVAIYAYEGYYQGLHGVEDVAVIEVSNEEEIANYAEDMAWGVIDNFGIREEIYEAENCEDEDEDDEFLWNDIEDRLETYWSAAEIFSDKSVKELDEEIANLGYDDFLKKYEHREID